MHNLNILKDIDVNLKKNEKIFKHSFILVAFLLNILRESSKQKE
jgi:hypothetical protein